MISELLSSGRTSRLYRSLVRDKKIAAGAAGFNGFPGDKYPNLFAFFAVTDAGAHADEMRDGDPRGDRAAQERGRDATRSCRW